MMVTTVLSERKTAFVCVQWRTGAASLAFPCHCRTLWADKLWKCWSCVWDGFVSKQLGLSHTFLKMFSWLVITRKLCVNPADVRIVAWIKLFSSGWTFCVGFFVFLVGFMTESEPWERRLWREQQQPPHLTLLLELCPHTDPSLPSMPHPAFCVYCVSCRTTSSLHCCRSWFSSLLKAPHEMWCGTQSDSVAQEMTSADESSLQWIYWVL